MLGQTFKLFDIYISDIVIKYQLASIALFMKTAGIHHRFLAACLASIQFACMMKHSNARFLIVLLGRGLEVMFQSLYYSKLLKCNFLHLKITQAIRLVQCGERGRKKRAMNNGFLLSYCTFSLIAFLLLCIVIKFRCTIWTYRLNIKLLRVNSIVYSPVLRLC